MKDWAGHIAIAALLIGLVAWLRADIAELREGQIDLRERVARIEAIVERYPPPLMAAADRSAALPSASQ